MWQPEAFESPPSESKNRPHFTTVTCYGIDNVTFSVPRAIKTILKKNMTNFFFTPCERPAQKVNMDESHHKIFLKGAKVRTIFNIKENKKVGLSFVLLRRRFCLLPMFLFEGYVNNDFSVI